MIKVIAAGLLLLCVLLVVFWSQRVKAEDVRNIILDTDISSDVDDVGAVAVLNALADQGKAQILAMMVSSGDPWSGPCLDALNTSFGRPDIPIGVIKNAAVTHVSKYTKFIANHYQNNLLLNGDAQEAFKLYRKILADQPDGSVIVVSVGYLSNLARLLKSRPDEYSSLDGKNLVLKKVKTLICMGGQFPSGREWNFYQDVKATNHVINHWPTQITFCGFEIGNQILTGKVLRDAPENHPLRVAYLLYNNITNRQSWDQAAVLLAVYSSGEKYKYWDISTKGKVIIDSIGKNTWNNEEKGQHNYMIWNNKTRQLAHIIDTLMLYSGSVSP
jgi:inosine-uridine nucleoside N-ribohydrolase